MNAAANDSDGRSAPRGEAMIVGSTSAVTSIFQLLADPLRMKIFNRISRREVNVVELSRYTQLSQPAVSYHLALLRDAGLIAIRRDGQRSYYRCVPERLTAAMRDFVVGLLGERNQMRFGDYVVARVAVDSSSIAADV